MTKEEKFELIQAVEIKILDTLNNCLESEVSKDYTYDRVCRDFDDMLIECDMPISSYSILSLRMVNTPEVYKNLEVEP